MTQNLVDLDYTPDALAAIDAALAALEAGFAGLLALTPDQRQMLTKMGDKSEAFCRKADAVFGENLAILPANFDLAAYRRDRAGGRLTARCFRQYAERKAPHRGAFLLCVPSGMSNHAAFFLPLAHQR